MCSTVSSLLVLGVVATNLITASGSHINTFRKYGSDDLLRMPPQLQHSLSVPKNFPLLLKPIRRYPNVKRATTLRFKQPSPSVLAIPYPHATRITNINPKGQHRVHSERPLGSSVSRSRRPPINTGLKRTNQNELLLQTRPNGVVGVNMKPVYEESMVQKMPVYINSFPEFEQQESSKNMRNLNYEPLGDYARF